MANQFEKLLQKINTPNVTRRSVLAAMSMVLLTACGVNTKPEQPFDTNKDEEILDPVEQAPEEEAIPDPVFIEHSLPPISYNQIEYTSNGESLMERGKWGEVIKLNNLAILAYEYYDPILKEFVVNTVDGKNEYDQDGFVTSKEFAGNQGATGTNIINNNGRIEVSTSPETNSNIFCSMPVIIDGNPVIISGHNPLIEFSESNLQASGTKNVSILIDNKWQPLQDLTIGRWYPGVLLLPPVIENGVKVNKLFILGGVSEDSKWVETAEIYSIAEDGNSYTEQVLDRDIFRENGEFPENTPYYPDMEVVSVDYANMIANCIITGPQDITTFQIDYKNNRVRNLNESVLDFSNNPDGIIIHDQEYTGYGKTEALSPGKYLRIGGNTQDPSSAIHLIEALDKNGEILQPPHRRLLGNMNKARSYVNAVTLPSGDVLIAGGSSQPTTIGSDNQSQKAVVKEVLLFSRKNNTIIELDPIEVARTYHSTMFMSGTGVIIAGGNTSKEGLGENPEDLYGAGDQTNMQYLNLPSFYKNNGELIDLPQILAYQDHYNPLKKGQSNIEYEQQLLDQGYTSIELDPNGEYTAKDISNVVLSPTAAVTHQNSSNKNNIYMDRALDPINEYKLWIKQTSRVDLKSPMPDGLHKLHLLIENPDNGMEAWSEPIPYTIKSSIE